jgi:hypothetical protein
VRLIFLHDHDAEAGAFIDRLHDIRRLHRVFAADIEAVHDLGLSHGNARSFGDLLGLLLVHRQRGGKNTRVSVRNFEIFQDALNRTVFAVGSMQGIECHIRPQISEYTSYVAPDIDTRHPIALSLKRVRASIP